MKHQLLLTTRFLQKTRAILPLLFILQFLFATNSYAVTSNCIVNGGDWATPATWDNGVPTTGIDAVIPAGFIPAITTPVACDNLAFSATTTATLTLGGDLTINGNLTLTQTGAANTITIAAAAKTLTINGTVTFSAVGTSTISASTGVLTFNSAITLGTLDNIVFSGAGTANFSAGLTDAAGSMTLVSGTTVNMAGFYTVNSGNAFWATGSNLIYTATTTVTATSNIFFYNVTINSGVINHSGPAYVYGNWIVSTGTTLIYDGVFSGTGSKTFTAAAGAFVNISGSATLPTGFKNPLSFAQTSTVDYNGTGAQYVAPANYGNLTFSNTGARTLAASGTIGIAGTFAPGSNSCTLTGSTINFNGTTAQTIPVFNYNNLIISGARTVNNVTLDASGSIGVAGTFSSSASFTSGALIITNSTIDFNGSGAQTIGPFKYYNLTVSGTRTTNDVTFSNGTIGIFNNFNLFAAFTSGAYIITSGNYIDFNGTGAQTIPAFNYQYFTISGTRGSNNVTLENGGTIGLAGPNSPLTLTATFTTGTYISANNTINFNSPTAQNVTIPAVAFINNLTFNCAGGAKLINAITATTVTGNIAIQTGSLANGGFAITGNGSATFSVAAAATLSLTGTSTMPTGFGTVTLGVTSLVDYNGVNSAQTIAAYDYGNLSITGTRNDKIITFANGGTIGIAGTFISSVTFGTGKYITTNSTINYNGASPQKIIVFKYNNLTSSSTGARTLDSVGIIDIKGAFISGTNTYTTKGSTVAYTATSAQTIAPLNYYNLTTSGTRGANNITFANGGTVGVASVLSLTASFTTGKYVLTNNTIDYNGGVAQDIQALPYNNLTVSNAGRKKLAASITVTGALTINPGPIFDVNNTFNYSLLLGGNFSNNATFNGRAGTVTFNGFTTIGGSSATAFNNVVITGSLTGPPTTMNVKGNWQNNNVFLHNNGTVDFIGTSAITGSAITNFNNLTISGPGPVTSHPTSINVAGNFTNTGTFAHNNATVNFNGTSTIGGTSKTQFYVLSITTGSLTAPADTLRVLNNWFNEGTFNHNGGTVKFTGTTTIGGSVKTTFNTIVNTGALTGHATEMDVKGDIVNEGTYNSNNGTLVLNGTLAQNLSGAGTSNYEALTFSNASGVTISDGIHNLYGAIKLNTGLVNNVAGTFTLKSGATRYAHIAEIECVGCDFAGNYIVERYFPARSVGTWANLSSPVSNATMSDWQNELFLQYTFDGFDPVTNRPKNSNVMAYDEPTASYVQLSSATPLAAGKGFEIGLVSDSTASGFRATTLTSVGKPNTGAYIINLDFTGAPGDAYPAGYAGENLIGNPYASAIRVGAMTFTNTLSEVDVYDYSIDNYTTLHSEDILGPYQAFWAYAQNTGASVLINEGSKVDTTNQKVHRMNTTNLYPYLSLKISSADNSNSMAHTLLIAAKESASDGWDKNDHPFRRSLNPKAPYITANAGKAVVSTNTFNTAHNTYTMPLNVAVGMDGNYKIDATGMENIRAEFPFVSLEDRLTHAFTDLNAVTTYTFAARATDSDKRFVLHFSKSENNLRASAPFVNDLANQVTILQNATGNVINFNLVETENSIISVVDLLGKKIVQAINVEANNQSVSISLPENYRGMYLVVVEGASGKVVKKFTSVH